MEESLFESNFVDMTIDELKKRLSHYINDSDLIRELSIGCNKDKSISVRFRSNIVCKLIKTRNPYLWFKRMDDILDDLQGIPFEKQKILIDLDKKELYLKLIGIAFVKRALAEKGDSFACCHLYQECSDALRCVHQDFLISLGCSYRKNLEKGRVFYGKNKTI